MFISAPPHYVIQIFISAPPHYVIHQLFISALSHFSHSTACLINLSPWRCNGQHITYFPSVVEPELWVKA